MTRIGHASHDEKGKYSGGLAGDQTGQEVFVRDWYNRPWNVVIYAEDANIREKMAQAMEQACANNNIGYDQGTSGNVNDRYTLYRALQKNGFEMSKIDTKVETDCSNLVACCANCAGVQISPYIYTGNEKKAFQNAKNELGQKVNFIVKTESKFISSPDYIPRGAILLYEKHHTAIQLDNGKMWNDPATKKAPVEIKVTGTLKIVGASSLAVRDYPAVKDSKVIKIYSLNDTVQVVSKALMDGTYWFKTNEGYWISGKYVEGVLIENSQNNRSWIVEQGYKYSKNTVKLYNNKYYCIDKEGWIITPDYMNQDGSLK